MPGFERLELVHQGVELGIGDLRRRLNVVELFVVADLLPERLDAISWSHSRNPLRSRYVGRGDAETRSLK